MGIRTLFAAAAVIGMALAASSARADTIYWAGQPSGYRTVYATDVATESTSTFLADTHTYGVNLAGSLATGPGRDLYIAQFSSNGNEPPIIKVSPSGVVTTVTQQPAAINGLAFDSQGNLYFGSEGGFNVIEKLTPGGTQTTFASGLQNPRPGMLRSARKLVRRWRPEPAVYSNQNHPLGFRLHFHK